MRDRKSEQRAEELEDWAGRVVEWGKTFDGFREEQHKKNAQTDTRIAALEQRIAGGGRMNTELNRLADTIENMWVSTMDHQAATEKALDQLRAELEKLAAKAAESGETDVAKLAVCGSVWAKEDDRYFFVGFGETSGGSSSYMAIRHDIDGDCTRVTMSLDWLKRNLKYLGTFDEVFVRRDSRSVIRSDQVGDDFLQLGQVWRRNGKLYSGASYRIEIDCGRYVARDVKTGSPWSTPANRLEIASVLEAAGGHFELVQEAK